MGDHDQRFKALLTAFLPEFLRLILPEGWPERLDAGAADWLDKEAFLDPPEGDRRSLDLVAKVPTHEPVGGKSGYLALIHVEVESADKAAPLRPRMAEYYWHLRAKHELPVLPLALFLCVGLDGIGWDTYAEDFWGEELLRFRYRYVGFPALEGEGYLEGDNLLAVALASLMKLPKDRKAEFKALAMRRVATSGENQARQFLLAEAVDSYLDLDAEQQSRYEALLQGDEMEAVHELLNPWEERGKVKGRAEGQLQGQRETLRILLEGRFGELPPEAAERLNAMGSEELLGLARSILNAGSLKELSLQD